MVAKIIKCGASWCAPCKAFAKTLNKIKESNDYPNISFEEYDIEEDEAGQELTEKFKIMSVPTTILLDENGELLTKVLGNVNETSFRGIIEDNNKK